MNRMWTHLRRLAKSLMLLALTSFVLHSGAMAGPTGHGTFTFGAGEGVSRTSESRQMDDEGGRGLPEVTSSNTRACALSDNDHDGDRLNDLPHCGNVCGIALPSFDLGAVAAPATDVTLAMLSQRGSEMGHGHERCPSPTGP